MYILMICEPGEWVAAHFEGFSKKLEQCNWHLLPIDIKRLYLIFLIDTQQPINIQCYGGILCTRDTFKKVALIINFDAVNLEYVIPNLVTFFRSLDIKDWIFLLHGSSSV